MHDSIAVLDGDLQIGDIYHGVIIAEEDIPLAPEADPILMALDARESAIEAFEEEAGILCDPFEAVTAIFREDTDKWEIRYRVIIVGFGSPGPQTASAFQWVLLAAVFVGTVAFGIASYGLVRISSSGDWRRTLEVIEDVADAAVASSKAIVVVGIIAAAFWFLPRNIIPR